MQRYLLTLVLSVAVMALRIASASPSPLPHWSARANDYKQVADVEFDDADSGSDGTYDVFYDGLSSDGRWFYEDDYGYVWQPDVAVSTPDWRPYSDGHWVWTDRGWYWDSDENFGWATYHYGRWILVEDAGWIWVPGTQWAPAWVSWRHSSNDDYVGWAPLPPESRFNVQVGFHAWSDSYYGIGPAAYAFIRIVDFARPSYREFCLPPQQNIQIIQRTTNITNITYQNNVINNFGPPHERIAQLVQQQSGQTLPSYKINYAAQTQPGAAFKTSVQGNQLNVAAPPHALKPVATAAPQVSRQLGKARINRGWQNVPQTQAQQIQQQFAQQAPAPNNLPAKPTLPVKPQIQASAQPGTQPPNAAAPNHGTPATRAEVKPPVQSETTKLTVQSPAATPVEHLKAPKTAEEKKPEVLATEAKATTTPGNGNPVARTEVKPPVQSEATKPTVQSPVAASGKHETEVKAAHPGEKPAGHTAPPKPKEEEANKSTPPATSESHRPESDTVAHHEIAAPGEHRVAAAKVSKPAARPDEKKPEEKKKPEENHE